MWAGIDVGAQRKGFHCAVVDDSALVAGPTRCASVADAVGWIGRHRPAVVAVDSPRVGAAPGFRSREGERILARTVCGIRYTPEEAALIGPYYGWIRHGLELYRALAAGASEVIECFPTASWTRWAGPRGSRRRSAWTREALPGLRLEGVPPRLSQDGRDAIAAAVTARDYARGRCEQFDEIVVPIGPGHIPR